MFREKAPPYFGIWFDECQPARNREHALGILEDAAGRSYDEDVRTHETLGALAWLLRECSKPVLCHRYRQALDVRDPADRFRAATAAATVLRRHLEG